MNKHIPSNIKPLPIYPSRVEFCYTNQVITFLKRDKQELQMGNTSLRLLTTQSAATLRDTLVQAANAHADHLAKDLVSTRHRNPDGKLHPLPQFYIDGEELIVRPLSSPEAQAFHGFHYDSTGKQINNWK